MNHQETITDAIAQRVLVLDGSMGVEIQRLGLSDADFRGERFAGHPTRLAGNNDLLVLTRPDAIAGIHRAYLEAGADIIETNSFNANALSQKEYGLEHLVEEINREAAQLARREADAYMARHPEASRRYVAGSIGPTAVSASLSADVDDPSRREVDFDTLLGAYTAQASALIDGGVDLLVIETVFDVLNAKAALVGARDAMHARGREVPVIVSCTLSDASQRLLSGHTLEAFLVSIAFARPLAVGLNCSTGPEGMMDALRRLSKISPFATIAYPNAGLPDETGNYRLSAFDFAADMKRMADERLVNIAGGCCGTGPAHILALRASLPQDAEPRNAAPAGSVPWLAGLEGFSDGMGFINVGERCNVAGSRKFLRLVKEGNWTEACAIARKQVEDGAQLLDINLDDAMLDSAALMVKFLRLLGADPVTASVPWMIDSSDFAVTEQALKVIPGKGIVNSISLKHGEEEFLRQAATVARYGCAVVVMAFDEQGQAATLDRKIEICSRAYELLTHKAGYDPRDIIFDPNVLTVATGMSEHDAYAYNYIEAVRWIARNLPGAKTSGGVSNLSFAFRGNNYIRQALHAVFLYHAIEAGLTMAIIDPGSKVAYSDIPESLLRLLDDVVLNTRPDAAERLIAAASQYTDGAPTGNNPQDVSADDSARTPHERIVEALTRGDDSRIADDLQLLVDEGMTGAAIVEHTLMAGMERVGSLFETGKLFLPQVVKSARVMHKAVEWLRPVMEREKSAADGGTKATFLVATVKGDVHDIGKNIVSVVLRCNNFKVIDLGVQVDAPTIVEAALREKPDFIGLSGLISPSLEEMRVTVRALREAGVAVPVLVGGAATSEVHTAVRIAPEYGGVVVRVNDAAQNPLVASRLLADPEGEAARIRAAQRATKEAYEKTHAAAAGADAPLIDWDEEQRSGAIAAPHCPGSRVIDDITLSDVRPLINWTYFYNLWKVSPDSDEAKAVRKEADALLDTLADEPHLLRASMCISEAYSRDGKIVVKAADGTDVVLAVERQKPSARRKKCESLADYVAPQGYADHLGAFVVTVGTRLRQLAQEARESGDDYRLIMLQAVSDRLVEAASEWLHHRVRTHYWGYAEDEPFDATALKRGIYRGIRPAVGYPSLPDQRMMHQLAKLVHPETVDVQVTENGALWPSSSVAGFYFASPRARYFSVDA